ncbi:hypothetical protein [Deinococcus sp. 23YEL01]|uniref:hypothetical protein n=1 Tax=Deinococcus sp. 23YEL01 TaxID=2745871 RepID=UPI001E55821E|nr:hypothetical protein [Deinococcus sp. 23YEL01]MCD0169820.1 hypothetical protein [Deinococcus sp. 23YEL01]
MTPDSLPNTFPAPKWARVVQAVTWAEYGLNEEGRITEKSVRGPVIVWGRTSGEGEDLPRLEAPTPSPLELETARLNMRPHIQAFVQGGVRSIGKWKSFEKLTWLVAARQFKRLLGQGTKAVGKIGQISLHELRSLSGKCRKASNLIRLLNIYKDPFSFGDSELFEALRALSQFGNLPKNIQAQCFAGLKRFEYRKALWKSSGYPEECRDWAYIQIFMWEPTRQLIKRSRRRIHEAQVVLDAVRAAFRAHLARRVRPVSRRSRVPRPLYARPRPPSCPLAPPVA